MSIYSYTLSVSDTSSSVTVTNSFLITIRNIGNKRCFINFTSTATTNDFPIDPGEKLTIGLKGITTISAICNSGDATTLRILVSDGA